MISHFLPRTWQHCFSCNKHQFDALLIWKRNIERMERFREHEESMRDGSFLSSIPLNSSGLCGKVSGVSRLLFGRHPNLTVTQSSCNPITIENYDSKIRISGTAVIKYIRREKNIRRDSLYQNLFIIERKETYEEKWLRTSIYLPQIYGTDKHAGFKILSSQSTFFLRIYFFPSCEGTTHHTASEFCWRDL